MTETVFRILAINPGSTSTKIAVYENEKPIFEQTRRHSAEDLAPFADIQSQYEFRKAQILDCLAKGGVDPASLSAVVGRGGLFRPIEGGTYAINDRVLEDARRGVQGQHASNIGAPLAKGIADQYGLPSYFVDPPCVDEFEPLARLSGMPDLPRHSLLHALNLKAVGHRVARDLGRRLEDLNLVMAHLGGGISVVPSKHGRFIDANNATEEGPFSPERTGTLPVRSLIQLCYSGKYTAKEMDRKVVGQGGMVAYLGTNDAQEVQRRIASGDTQARLVFEAMAYQVAKEIGAMAAVLAGKVDYVVLTGGIAHSEMLTGWIRERTEWIAPVLIYPGEEELRALVEGALRVLRGQERPKVYA
ncbi:MAG: butyrate kinase [Chloroflexota bacterium]